MGEFENWNEGLGAWEEGALTLNSQFLNPKRNASTNAVERYHNFFAQFGRVFRRFDRLARRYLGWSNWPRVSSHSSGHQGPHLRERAKCQEGQTQSAQCWG